jgi:hypothetical protein
MGTILVVSNARDVHVEPVIRHLREWGIPYVRLNVEDYPTELSVTLRLNRSGKWSGVLLRQGEPFLSLADVGSVWYRRPVRSRLDPRLDAEDAAFAHSEIGAFLEGFWSVLPAFWVSPPRAIVAARSKMYQLTLARTLGFMIPRTVVTNNPEHFRHFLCRQKDVVVKTLGVAAVRRSEHDCAVYTSRVTQEHAKYASWVSLAPTFLQEYVPKDVEIRATVVGHEVYACEIHSQLSERSRDDWRRYDLERTPYLQHDLPPRVRQMCVRLVRRLGLAFGAIDLIRRPDGSYVFLEINPNGQWLWVEELTGLPISWAIARLLAKSIERRKRI